jgi:hypothetical protein
VPKANLTVQRIAAARQRDRAEAYSPNHNDQLRITAARARVT